MYGNFEEVVRAVREKYENATSLSIGTFHPKVSLTPLVGCQYSHKSNDIGCAIGCLFPADVAETFDRDVIGVRALANHKEFSDIFHSVISEDILIEELEILQGWHDHSTKVEEFREKLDEYLSKLTHREPELEKEFA